MQTTDVQSCLNGLKYISGCLLSNKGGFMVRLYCMYRRLVYYRKEELILLLILLLMTVNFRGGVKQVTLKICKFAKNGG